MKTVILAAGFGSRLWPISTSDKPKQFQPIFKQRSLLQNTYELFARITGEQDLYVLTLKGLEHLVRQELPGLLPEHIISVPERRNTLPHTLFALNLIADSPDEPILFTTVDHYIIEEEAFVASLRKIIQKYNPDLQRVTLLPNKSKQFDANAGYLKLDSQRNILQFLEKPSRQDVDRLAHDNTEVYKATAMYLASQKTFSEALDTIPDSLAHQSQELLHAPDAEREARFLDMPLMDIAKGFYEKATSLYADFTDGDFVDLGSFGSLYKVGQKDGAGNVVVGNVILDGSTTNSLVVNETSKPLVVINVQDSVVVQAEAGTVVAPRNQVDKVGELYKTKIHTNADYT